MFNEHKIRIFLHVAKTKSFTKSAQQLYLSQQAVSKTVSELESDVGKPLFNRGYHALELTPEGTELRKMCIDFMRNYDTFIQFTNPTVSRKMKLKVGYLRYCFYEPEFSRVFSDLSIENPNITFIPGTYTPEQIVSSIDDSSVDVAFTRDLLLPENNSYCIREICCNHLYLAAALSKKSGTPDDIKKCFFYSPLIINAIENETVEEALTRGHREAERYGIHTNSIIIAQDRETARLNAEMGAGVMSVSDNSLIFHSNALQFYKTPYYDKTVCFWQDSEYTPLFNDYCNRLIELIPADRKIPQ